MSRRGDGLPLEIYEIYASIYASPSLLRISITTLTTGWQYLTTSRREYCTHVLLAFLIKDTQRPLPFLLIQPFLFPGAMTLFLNQGRGCLALRMTHAVPWASEDQSHVIALALSI